MCFLLWNTPEIYKTFTEQIHQTLSKALCQILSKEIQDRDLNISPERGQEFDSVVCCCFPTRFRQWDPLSLSVVELLLTLPQNRDQDISFILQTTFFTKALQTLH